MVYRDDENNLLYVSIRIAVQLPYIVVFRKVYMHDVVGEEEPNPIHADDVERMLRVFLLDSQPLVVLPCDNSATKVEVLQASSVAATMSNGAKTMSNGNKSMSHGTTSGRKCKAVTFESGAKHSAEPLSEGALDVLSEATHIKRRALEKEKGVHEPRKKLESYTSAPAHDSKLVVQPPGTTSHRFPRSAHNVNRHVVHVGKPEEHSLCVKVNHNDDCYELYMPHCLKLNEVKVISGLAESYQERYRWECSRLNEIKSHVCEPCSSLLWVDT